ncbi:putative RNA-directed DNA polymerase from transposon X-element [Trichonephila clavipes]|nr:putative RNA-directed DNA polymerase from transposon X-element [Trichonephila clavipes]
MTGGLPPLVGLHGGWRRTGMNNKNTHGTQPEISFSGAPFSSILRFVSFFFIVKTPDTFTNVSPFLIEKAFTSSIGRSNRFVRCAPGIVPRSVVDETGDRPYTSAKLAHLDVTVAPHTTLNFRAVSFHQRIFLNVSSEEIKENMQAQNVCDVRRITIRRDGQVLNTKHLILTFNTPDLPQTVKMAYIRCPVRPYIPHPLRCFQCQRFGHSKTVCRGQPTCSRCAEVGHDSADCKAKERCVNCKGDHSSFSRSCPTWLLEKEITAVKNKDKISYPEARRQFLEKAMRRRPEKHTYQRPFK